MKSIKKRMIRWFAVATLIACLFTITIFAYELDRSWKYNDPQSVSVYISADVPYINDIKIAHDNWNDCPEIYCYLSDNTNYQEVFIMYSPVNTGAVAVTGKIGTSDWKQVIVRPLFTQLKPTYRQETIAHEMGHCFGLNDITTEILMSSTLMRGSGFNGNAFPYQDDKAGITDLYG